MWEQALAELDCPCEDLEPSTVCSYGSLVVIVRESNCFCVVGCYGVFASGCPHVLEWLATKVLLGAFADVECFWMCSGCCPLVLGWFRLPAEVTRVAGETLGGCLSPTPTRLAFVACQQWATLAFQHGMPHNHIEITASWFLLTMGLLGVISGSKASACKNRNTQTVKRTTTSRGYSLWADATADTEKNHRHDVNWYTLSYICVYMYIHIYIDVYFLNIYIYTYICVYVYLCTLVEWVRRGCTRVRVTGLSIWKRPWILSRLCYPQTKLCLSQTLILEPKCQDIKQFGCKSAATNVSDVLGFVLRCSPLDVYPTRRVMHM